MDELILENGAVNITDISTALEMFIGTVHATSHEERMQKPEGYIDIMLIFGCQAATTASLYAED